MTGMSISILSVDGLGLAGSVLWIVIQLNMSGLGLYHPRDHYNVFLGQRRKDFDYALNNKEVRMHPKYNIYWEWRQYIAYEFMLEELLLDTYINMVKFDIVYNEAKPFHLPKGLLI